MCIYVLERNSSRIRVSTAVAVTILLSVVLCDLLLEERDVMDRISGQDKTFSSSRISQG